jgi:hypothetical protein
VTEATRFDPEVWLRSGIADPGEWPGRLAAPGRAIVAMPEETFAARPSDLEIAVPMPDTIIRRAVTRVTAVADLADSVVLTIVGFTPGDGLPDGWAFEDLLTSAARGTVDSLADRPVTATARPPEIAALGAPVGGLVGSFTDRRGGLPEITWPWCMIFRPLC